MRVIRSAEYTPLRKGHPDYGEPLLVHAQESSNEHNLIIFVHGLNGTRYKTWGQFPEFTFKRLPELDIGMYDYASGVRRIKMLRSVRLEAHAAELADSLRDGRYTNIVLVGHSMGGLLCKAVIKQLLDSQARSSDGVRTIERIAGLILFATPQAGSLRVPGLARMTKDGRALHAHSNLVTSLDNCFKDRIEGRVQGRGNRLGRIGIPTYAVLGNSDFWVDSLSAALGLPSEHTKTVRGSHTTIVKLRHPDSQLFDWFAARVRQCISIAPTRSIMMTTNGSMKASDFADLLGRRLEEFMGELGEHGNDFNATITIDLNEEKQVKRRQID